MAISKPTVSPPYAVGSEIRRLYAVGGGVRRPTFSNESNSFKEQFSKDADMIMVLTEQIGRCRETRVSVNQSSTERIILIAGKPPFTVIKKGRIVRYGVK